jgi:hypothetical protein
MADDTRPICTAETPARKAASDTHMPSSGITRGGTLTPRVSASTMTTTTGATIARIAAAS